MSGTKDIAIMFNKFRDAEAKICILERKCALLDEALDALRVIRKHANSNSPRIHWSRGWVIGRTEIVLNKAKEIENKCTA